MTDDEFIVRLYDALLLRSPNVAELRHHLSALSDSRDPKETFLSFCNSEEFKDRRRERLLDIECINSCVTDSRVARLEKYRLRVLEILSPLNAQDVLHYKKVRIGRNHDGGYVMIDDFEGIDAAYSLGISDDVSWDLAFAELDIDIFQYDHSINELPVKHNRFHWSKLKIASESAFSNETISLQRAFDGNAHSVSRDYIIKIDIEGSEWDMFADTDPSYLRAFRQIVCEFHGFHKIIDDREYSKMVRAIQNVTTHHNVVHVHGNNFTPWAIIGGVAIPDTLEITFIRRQGRNFQPSKSVFPTSFDQPNNPELADMYLGNFNFPVR
ncbi:DUF4214 domain-containing protein [Methylobacterium sp. GXS13]|uniref:DUF4214 domain-containing protein n=1 Tax=Methylobacterium sp. GXS13 TaxID=1730094 RepID=UPI000B329FCD|nr:DUF4214 domain-containing protein [Methylobacterium sp. GXS13]